MSQMSPRKDEMRTSDIREGEAKLAAKEVVGWGCRHGKPQKMGSMGGWRV